MSKLSIRFFEDKEVRPIWDEVESKWWFNVVDIVGILNGQPDYTKAGNYWRWLKRKMIKEENEFVSATHRLKFVAADGKKYLTDALDSAGVVNLAKQFPNNKAMQFLDWFLYSDNTIVGEAFEIIGFGLVLVCLLFALIFQLYFDGPVSDVFFWGITRTVRMPGVIFTLDIGGIIFLITVKLALAILSFLLGVFFALLGLLIASLFAGFTFPFMVIKVNRSVREGSDLSPI